MMVVEDTIVPDAFPSILGEQTLELGRHVFSLDGLAIDQDWKCRVVRHPVRGSKLYLARSHRRVLDLRG
jgi:hypothetical protein